MSNNLKSLLKSITLVIVIFGLSVALLSNAYAKGANPNPRVIPINANAHGMSYGEWSAKWWQWVFSLPDDQNPLLEDNSCERVANGQFGPVWFLGGVFNESGTANRVCTVPTGKALFFPIINAECSTLEGDGVTEGELRTCAQGLIDGVDILSAEINGESINGIEFYRAESPFFTFGPLPANNLFGAAPGTTSPSVADGYYLMLPPLSAGQHTIHFIGGISGVFQLDITYQLNVVPAGPPF